MSALPLVRREIERLNGIHGFELEISQSSAGIRILDGRTGRDLSPRARPAAIALWLDGFGEAIDFIDSLGRLEGPTK